MLRLKLRLECRWRAFSREGMAPNGAEHALTLVVALLIFLLLRASLPFGRRCSQMPPRILSADDKLLADSFHIRSRLSPCLHLPLNTATQYHYSNCLAFG